MTIQQKMEQSVKEWVASSGGEKEELAVHAILDTDEYGTLPYLERNRPFLTSSKLRAFRDCAYHAYLKYVKEEPTDAEEEDYFVIGSAVDRRLTDGEEAYQGKYAAVKIRNDKAATENPGKILLTNSQAQTIDQAVKEYQNRAFFPKAPAKRNVLFLLHGLPCKCELDNFDPIKRVIGDIKTTASITTFDPSMYALQMSFYALGIEKRFGEKVSAELFVIDKHSGFSRSHKWVFSPPTLASHYYEIENLVQQWKDSIETGIWPHHDVSTEEGQRISWQAEYWPVCQFCRQMEPTIL